MQLEGEDSSRTRGKRPDTLSISTDTPGRLAGTSKPCSANFAKVFQINSRMRSPVSGSLQDLRTCRIWLLPLINTIGNANQRSTRTRSHPMLLPPHPLPTPILPTSRPLPTTVLAVNSLALNRTTDNSRITRIRRSLHCQLPPLLRISPTLSLACLDPTESSLPRNASAIWTTSSAFIVERLAIWFWIVPRAPSLRLRLGPQPPLLLLPLLPPLQAQEKRRQSSVRSTAGGLQNIQW